jgi:hypothetical protein
VCSSDLDAGKQDKIRKFVIEHAHELVRARKSAETMKAKLKERRAKLLPPPPDKTDMAGAVMRSEMRAMMRGLNNGQRAALMLSPNADPMLLAAVLEAPDSMTGITDQIREQIHTNLIERNHPGALASLDVANDAIILVETAGRMATNAAIEAGKFPSDTVLSEFVNEALPDTRALDADIDRSFSSLAEVA